MDAIDGKQARRTSSSSVLGQLVDHGLDSYSLVFLFLGMSQAVLMPVHLVIILATTNFVGIYVANWSEAHLGKMLTKVGVFGVTESQFVLISVQLVTALKGQLFWQETLSTLLPLCLNSRLPPLVLTQPIYMYLYLFVVPLQLSMLFYVVFLTLVKASRKGHAFCQFLPCLVIVSNYLLWTFHPYTQDHLVLLILIFGTIMSTQCCKLILSSTTKTHYHILSTSLFTTTLFSALLLALPLYRP